MTDQPPPGGSYPPPPPGPPGGHEPPSRLGSRRSLAATSAAERRFLPAATAGRWRIRATTARTGRPRAADGVLHAVAHPGVGISDRQRPDRRRVQHRLGDRTLTQQSQCVYAASPSTTSASTATRRLGHRLPRTVAGIAGDLRLRDLELRLPPGHDRLEPGQVGAEDQGGQRDTADSRSVSDCRSCASSLTSSTRSSATSASCFRSGTPSGKPWPTRS